MGFLDGIRALMCSYDNGTKSIDRFLEVAFMTREGSREGSREGCGHRAPKVCKRAFVKIEPQNRGWIFAEDYIVAHLREVPICKNCSDRVTSFEKIGKLGLLKLKEYHSKMERDDTRNRYVVYKFTANGFEFGVRYRIV